MAGKLYGMFSFFNFSFSILFSYSRSLTSFLKDSASYASIFINITCNFYIHIISYSHTNHCPNKIIYLFQLYFNIKIDSHHSDCLPTNEIFEFRHYPCLSTDITKRNSHRSGSYRWIAKSTITESILPINRQIDHICRLNFTLYYMKSQRKISIVFSYILFSLVMI